MFWNSFGRDQSHDLVHSNTLPPKIRIYMQSGPEQRLRLARFEFQREHNGQCEARVALRRPTGDVYTGAASGGGSETAQLRCAAEATVEALKRAVEARYSFALLDASFELMGAKTVQAFDNNVVLIGLLANRGDQTWRLVGASVAEQGLTRAAALAVLKAVNRFTTLAPFPVAPSP